MNRVLIVDDESIIREGLKTFPWGKYGCELVGEAADGEEGLLLTGTLQPDIVVSDIKMPGMDGIELAYEIQRAYPDVGVILLTGYEEFAYAQAAVQVGIRDYLLKPTDTDTLGASLVRVGALIEARRAKRSCYERMERQLTEARPFLQARLVDDLINGKYLSENDAKSALELCNIRTGSYLVVAVDADSSVKLEFSSFKESQLFCLAVENICREIFLQNVREAVGNGNPKGMAYLLVFAPNAPAAGSVSAAAKACEQIQHVVHRRLNVPISFGISRATDQLLQLYEAGEQARTALDHRFFIGENTIICFDDLKVQSQTEWFLPGQQGYVCRLVQTGNEEGVCTFFNDLGIQMKFRTNGDTNKIKSSFICLTLAALRAANSAHEEDIAERELSFLQKAMDCSTQDRLLRLVCQTICQAARENREENSSRCDDTGKQMEQYITNHYAEDLSLDILSEQFHLSSAYISRLLKNRTGRGFLEILVDIRMERAKWFLSAGTYQVQQVAEMVGYRDFSYFIQVFKKRYGITPNDYKAMTLPQGDRGQRIADVGTANI